MSHPADDERLLAHEYDGIQEYDNPLPRWWVWFFYASIVFSVVYFLDPTRTLAGPGREVEYAGELARHEARLAAAGGPGIDPAQLAAAIADPGRQREGEAVYAQNCAACHRADGGGLIGPNLTDGYWLHGGQPAEIYRTIAEGVLAKGMPAWEKMLKPEQLVAVTAYVAQLPTRPAADGKAPEGDQRSVAGGASAAP